MKILLAILTIAATGCVNAGLAQQIQRLQQENAALRKGAGKSVVAAKSAAERMPGVVDPRALQPRLLHAKVDWRPAYCNDGFCYMLRNMRPHPIGRLLIDGEPVLIESRTGLIPPRSTAYIRLPDARWYTVRAEMMQTVGGPRGERMVTPKVAEWCEQQSYVGGVNDHTHGGHQAIIGSGECSSQPR